MVLKFKTTIEVTAGTEQLLNDEGDCRDNGSLLRETSVLPLRSQMTTHYDHPYRMIVGSKWSLVPNDSPIIAGPICSRLSITRTLANIRHQTSDWSDIGNQTTDIIHQGSDTGHRASDIGHEKSELADIRHKTSEVWHLTSDIIHLTPDIKHQKSDIWHRTSDVRRLTSDIRGLTTKHQTSDIRNMTSDIRY